MKLKETSEMYLETILVLNKWSGEVRAVDLAAELGNSKPTVSEQLKKLRANGYVDADETGHLTLTDAGRAIAEETYERHNVIAEIFMTLGVSEQTAYRDACRVEHYISQETFDCMKTYFQNNRKG